MKKLFLTILTTAGIASAIASSDSKNKNEISESSPVNINYEAGKKVKLTVLDDQKGIVDLTVVDKRTGKKIADHSLTYTRSFELPIDMTSEDDGQYEFTVKGKDFELKQEVFLSSMTQDDVFATIDQLGNGKFNVKVLHNDVPVSLKIMDKNGRIYHKYVHLRGSNFEKEIDLSKIIGNTEMFISITGGKTSIYKAL